MSLSRAEHLYFFWESERKSEAKEEEEEKEEEGGDSLGPIKGVKAA